MDISKYILPNVRIIDSESTWNEKVVSILVENGIIQSIGKVSANNTAQVISLPEGSCVSPGLCDIGTMHGDPGAEEREDLHTLVQAAMRGGYLTLATFPNTIPVVDNKSAITYLVEYARKCPIQIFPIGALTAQCKGEDITEMFDMYQAGAIAFSDGMKSILHAGVLMRALIYAAQCNTPVMHFPYDSTLSPFGQMHEGNQSTQLGLKGIPAIAEETMIQRDLGILEYTNGRLHFVGVSTRGGVAFIREAKKKGLSVTCSACIHHLMFEDSALLEFDSNFKILPPLRSHEDRIALIDGIKDGTIDSIITLHTPWDREHKEVEFPYSTFGSTGLETAFSQAIEVLKEEIPLTKIIQLMSSNNLQIIGKTSNPLKEGNPMHAMIWHPSMPWIVEPYNFQSKARNSMCIGHKFNAQVLGVAHATHIELSKILQLSSQF